MVRRGRDPGATGVVGVEGLVEQAGRWTAARTSRRSFLGRVGKVAVLVAAGPSIAELLVDPAEARVCGQSGVSPLCPTFDCNDVWGWCWYARGCCADGALKKICDCCAVNWPNVHGYCPSGTNVRCIVESCGTDPRLQTVAIDRRPDDALAAVAASVRRTRFPAGSPVVVLADGADALVAAIAAPVGAVLGAPVLPVARQGADAGVLGELRGLGAVRAVVVGAALPPELDAGLAGAGVAVERVGSHPDVRRFSREVANWIRTVNGAGRTVCVSRSGLSAASAPLAAHLGALGGFPLVVGVDSARQVGLPAWFVGPEVADGPARLPGSTAVGGGSVPALAATLADVAIGERLVGADSVLLAPRTHPGIAALAGLGAPLVLHEPGTLDGARDWLRAREARFGRARRVELVGSAGSLASGGLRELQSILNGFEVQKLVGTGGQGLPVIPQPPEERPIGKARPPFGNLDAERRARNDDPAAQPGLDTYWTERASGR